MEQFQNSCKVSDLTYHRLDLTRMLKCATHGDLSQKRIAPSSQKAVFELLTAAKLLKLQDMHQLHEDLEGHCYGDVQVVYLHPLKTPQMIVVQGGC